MRLACLKFVIACVVLGVIQGLGSTLAGEVSNPELPEQPKYSAAEVTYHRQVPLAAALAGYCPSQWNQMVRNFCGAVLRHRLGYL